MECYFGKFTGEQCPDPAVYKGKNTGNFTDTWTWCSRHGPPDEWREPVKVEREA